MSIFDKISSAAQYFRGGAENIAKDATNFVRSAAIALDGKERFAGHSSLWKLTDSLDRVSGVMSTTWRLDAASLKQRFVGPDPEYAKLLERLKNGVRWLSKVRHPGIVRVVSPLHEHKNGDLSFVTERVTCSLVERMTQLKAARNTDSWSIVGENSSGTNHGAIQQQQQQQQQQHQQSSSSRHQQQQQNSGGGKSSQMSIDEALFGPTSAAANSTSAAGGGGGDGGNYGGVSSASTVPHESSMNMDALDEAEVIYLLRGVAKALHFLHESVKLAHLNVAPESVVVIRGTDEDARAASLPGGAPNSSNSNSGAAKASQFKEVWKIADFSFACLMAELDRMPAQFCDHFVSVGGVRRIPTPGLNGGAARPVSSAAASGGGGDSALINRLVCPVLDFAAPEYVLTNKPCRQSDVFSFGQLTFAVVRAAAEPSSNSNNDPDSSLAASLPRSLSTANDIALYETQLTQLQAPFQNVGWDAGVSAWAAAVNADRLNRTENVDKLLTSADALGHAGAAALELSDGIAFLDGEERLQVFFQLHRALPVMPNGTCLRRVFPTLVAVADPAKPELHRYIAPLAIAASAVVGSHLHIFSGQGAAGPAVGDALAVVVEVFRVLFASTDLHCAIVMMEEHAKIVPAMTVIDDFTRQESSFFGGPTPQWIKELKDKERNLARSYTEMVLRAIRCDRINIAQPGVAAAATLLKHMSCGSRHELHPPTSMGPDAIIARREDVAAVEALLPFVAAHAFGTAPCNVGEETRNSAAATTAAFVASVIDDRRKVRNAASTARPNLGGGGSSDREREREPSPLEVSVERRCNATRDLFGLLIKLQTRIQNCSPAQQKNWVAMIGSAGKLIRPQDVAAQVLGVLGNAVVDSRLSDPVAQDAATELKDFTAYLIETRRLRHQ